MFVWYHRLITRFLRPVLLLLMLGMVLVATACGETTPVGTPSCKSSTVCYGVNYWVPLNTSFMGTPSGVMSKLFVALLTCDSSCLSESGFIGDYVLLGDTSLNNWFLVGYRADGTSDGKFYFYSGSNYGGLTTYTNMGLVDINNEVGNYLNFAVEHNLDPKNTYSQNYVTMIFADPSGGWSTANFSINTTSFSPGSIEMGDVVHGMHGEYYSSGLPSLWLSNRYTTATTEVYPVTSNFPVLLTSLSHGQILQNKPPYAQWLGVNIDGDAFSGECCKP